MNKAHALKLVYFRVSTTENYLLFSIAACIFYRLKLNNQKYLKINKHLQK